MSVIQCPTCHKRYKVSTDDHVIRKCQCGHLLQPRALVVGGGGPAAAGGARGPPPAAGPDGWTAAH